MLQDQTTSLSLRQSQVLAAVAARLSIKEIANQLGVSESLVNQVIRSLKESFAVNSLSELAQVYRELSSLGDVDCIFPATTFSTLPEGPPSVATSRRDAFGTNDERVTLHDASWQAVPPWDSSFGPSAVPGALDGKHAGLVRAALIGVVAILFFVLILMGLGVARGLTELTADLPPPRSN
jgi:DNA-binding CsgD family transcriptional regulator